MNGSASQNGGGTEDTALLARLSRVVEARFGLHFPPERLGDLERGMAAAASEYGFDTIESCLDWLLSAPPSDSRVKRLASHLTVGETYFFRDRNVFDILDAHILPRLIASRRGCNPYLRFWSAACSTGEEPYSLAMSLSRMLPDLRDWNITILATDISPAALQKAAAGVYGDWSFRETPAWVKTRYFTKRERRYEISPEIRRMVTFSSLNLAADPYPAIITATTAMDVVFCRNVLIYFSRDRTNTVIGNLSRCLVEGGWLVTSPVEAAGVSLPPQLHPALFPGAVLYRKGGATDGPPVRPAATTTPPPATAATGSSPQIPPPQRPAPPPTTPVHPATDILNMAERSRRLADEGKLAAASALCEEAVKYDKLNPVLHYLRATILQEMDRADEAAAALRRALYIDQEFAVAHFALGHLLRRRGKGREGAKHLDKARSLLQAYAPEDIPPESEGISAGRLIELIQAMLGIKDGGE